MLLFVIKLLWFLILIDDGNLEDVDTRIINGVEATNFIPYQASVRVIVRDQVRFGQGHTCGGVLISQRTIATAAHCLFDGTRQRNAFDVRVIFGSLNRYVYTEETVIRTVVKVIVHPGYVRGGNFAHDIGLIILRSPVEFTNAIHSIPLIDHEVEASTNCRVSGWGATTWQGFMPNELRKANVSIVERSFCNSTDSYGPTFVDGMICANGVNEDGVIDVCQGDSGGPLTCDGKLVGLTSFGVRCGSSLDHPGVYADVFYYRQWIEENWNSDGHKINFQMTITLLGALTNIFLLET